jgi:hypothetical protein
MSNQEHLIRHHLLEILRHEDLRGEFTRYLMMCKQQLDVGKVLATRITIAPTIAIHVMIEAFVQMIAGDIGKTIALDREFYSRYHVFFLTMDVAKILPSPLCGGKQATATIYRTSA